MDAIQRVKFQDKNFTKDSFPTLGNSPLRNQQGISTTDEKAPEQTSPLHPSTQHQRSSSLELLKLATSHNMRRAYVSQSDLPQVTTPTHDRQQTVTTQAAARPINEPIEEDYEPLFTFVPPEPSPFALDDNTSDTARLPAPSTPPLFDAKGQAHVNFRSDK